MSLTTELEALRGDLQKETPPASLSAFRRSIDDLSRSGIADRALKVGDRAPDFELSNVLGHSVRLHALLQDGPVVINFYRGGWCPFCTSELQAYQGALDGIRSLGATLVAISPETVDSGRALVDEQALEYQALSDPHNVAARQYGIVYRVRDELQSLYEDLGLDLPERNGDLSYELPVPATYVLDMQGVIRLAFVDPDYTRRQDPAEVLSILRGLQSVAA